MFLIILISELYTANLPKEHQKVRNRFITFINNTISLAYNLVILILIVGLFLQCNKKSNEKKTNEIITLAPVKSDTSDNLFLNIPLNNLKMDHGTIAKNQMLSTLLSPYNINGGKLAQLAMHNRDIFDVRKMRSGHEYTILYREDSIKVAEYLAYRQSAYQYYVFNFKDTGSIYSYSLPIDTIEKTFGSKITGSLIQTLIDNGIPGELGFKLSEILAWQVDFFKIRKDDWVKVIYDEYYVHGKLAEIGRIKAVEFSWMGTPYFGFYYHQDADNQYFDDKGKSLRKAFLKAPLDFSRISSRYTLKRFHPVQKIWKAHLGTDYAAPTGTPIKSVGDGLVIEAGYGRGNGNYIKVKHNETYTTQYLHMSKMSPSARRGKTVRQGQIIGYVGSTGLATGPHLCFRFWKNGKQIDPFTVKTPPTIPIKKEHEVAFEKTKTTYIAIFDKIDIQSTEKKD
jgi:murein DD-endopeptidase MepM/ murein hydrolase activator NlpD